MPRIRGEIAVVRPVTEVFDVVADERKEPSYNPQMLSVESLTPGPVGVGYRFATVRRGRRRPVEMLLTGGRHWTVQVAHLLVGLGVIGWGILLAARIRNHAEHVTPASRVSEARPDHLDIKATLSQREAAARFLAVRRVAVTGVSRTAAGHGANVVYQRLRERGYEVFAVNPNAERVEDDHAYPNLRSIPAAVEAVVIGTRPEAALDTVKECVDLGITRVWMHRLYGTGSVAADATRYGRDHGVMVIDGGCPLMFDPTADIGHKLLRRVATVTGNAPRRIERTTTSRTRDQTSIADSCDPLSSATKDGSDGHTEGTGP